MLADFLEPFWEALFEKTGVFGIFLAAAAPVILIIVLILIIFAFYSLFKVAKKKRLEKIYHEARYLEYRERYDEAWELDCKGELNATTGNYVTVSGTFVAQGDSSYLQIN